MNISADIKLIRKVIRTSLLSGIQQQSFITRLDSIERRWNDSNLYVGIVGEFSSGKSTLINSLIGQDYFVTNCVQGTTTVITSIRYGNSINLELRYKNGEIIRYSSNKLSLIERFLPDDYAKLSFADKIKIKASDFLSLNGKDVYMLKIFDIVTTSNEISKELDEVVVYYPSDFLKNGIVLIDTPGTDSLIDTHSEITRNAIANKCDLAFVIVPALTPVSITLSDFISENLEHCINHCHFLVTKIEMIKERDRQNHLAGVAKRLINMNEIDNPHVIAAPTLLSLENRGIIERTGLLNGLSSNEIEDLMSEYDKDISNLFAHIYESKDASKKRAIGRQLHDLINDVLSDLNILLTEKKELLHKKQSNRTIPLESLLSKLNRKEISSIHEIALDRIRSKFSSERSTFERDVYSDISNADSKDEIQGSMTSESSIKMGHQCFQACYNYTVEQTNWILSYCNDEIRKFANIFRDTYSIEPLEYSNGLDTNSISIKAYKNSFSTSSLSTFLLKRMFIKKETIREEMREAVRNYLIAKFDGLYNHYSSKIIKLNEKLNKSVDKLIQQYNKKFTKIIKDRIEQEFNNEQIISNEIEYIGMQIAEIQKLSITY